MRAPLPLSILIGLAGLAWAEDPASPYQRKKPKTALEMVGQGAEVPSGTPASQPTATNPFGRVPSQPDHALPAVILYSNGGKLPGYLWTPAGKEWRVYERSSKQYRDIPLDAVKTIEAHVEWERMEDDWRWKEGGSDVKVLTGHLYPNRKTYYTFTLQDERKVLGDIAQMFYVGLSGHVTQGSLHKRHEGKIGQTLADIPYVRQILFDEDAMRKAIRDTATTRVATRPARRSTTRTR